MPLSLRCSVFLMHVWDPARCFCTCVYMNAIVFLSVQSVLFYSAHPILLLRAELQVGPSPIKIIGHGKTLSMQWLSNTSDMCIFLVILCGLHSRVGFTHYERDGAYFICIRYLLLLANERIFLSCHKLWVSTYFMVAARLQITTKGVVLIRI